MTNPEPVEHNTSMKTDTTAAIEKIDAQLTEANAQLDKAKEQFKAAKERVSKLEELKAKLGNPEELLAYAIDRLLNEDKTPDAAPVVGQPQVQKVIEWLKSHPGKHNSSKICDGVEISKEDWKATKTPLMATGLVKADKGKGQGKAYQYKE